MPNGRRGAGLDSCLNDGLHPESFEQGGGARRTGLVGAVNQSSSTPRRFRSLPLAILSGGAAVPVATSPRSRLLGLALLDPAEAGEGLLIPRCRAVHTLGMRFPLDLHFLDAQGLPVAIRRAVGPRRFAFEPRARAVLELPALREGRS